MKAQIWKVYVSEGTLAAVHGFCSPILEMYFPEIGLCVNEKAFFLHYPDRYENKHDMINDSPAPELVSETEVPDELIPKLKILKEAQEIFKEWDDLITKTTGVSSS